ncbi:GTP-binding protein Der [Caulifigura coniformis]|uniref:GTP-binding protein Der n=1 Tax=Caulifigura coniformis TaxID=2527983 RepID=A0A517SLE6_9PLAN|nr:GTPase domain-containing protein [Caulifigura coniformis]QDT56949.1 GTP-binding protein Der [Caulifigura coniformis]
MISCRSLVLGGLFALPVLAYVVMGGYALWTTNLLSRLWWLLPVCWFLTWALSKIWRPVPAFQMKQADPGRGPAHWTARDQSAAGIIRDFQEQVEEFTPAQLTDPAFYEKQGQELAVALARHYHPRASDPYSSLTVPEVLAAIRLVVDDMEQWMLESVPGSRLLTIRHWQMLGSAPKWYRRLQDTAWVAAVLVNPLNVARYFSSRLTLEPVTTELQTELLAAVYLRYIRQLGYYFIEMNSGRLRGGANRYREAFQASPDRTAGRVNDNSVLRSVTAQPVTIALVGQVSSGKSSLVNALAGSHQAEVDLLPETQTVSRYQFQLGEPPVAVTLLDTPGYSEAGASAAQLKQIQAALREANCVLVVMDAHSPARDADVRAVRELEQWYVSQPRLKTPPMIGVLTHVDLLRPTLEWKPPYEWRTPTSPKEHSIHDAVHYVQGLFGKSLTAVAPICLAEQKERVWGVLDELMPAMLAALSEAHSVALLRAFEKDLDRDRLRLVFRQLRRSGSDLLKWWIDERLRPDSSAP